MGNAQQAIELYNTLIEAGVNYFIIYLIDLSRLDTLQLFGEEVLPAFR